MFAQNKGDPCIVDIFCSHDEKRFWSEGTALILTRKTLSIRFREVVHEMSLVESRCRHLRDLVPRPALAEFPQRPLDGSPLDPRVDCLGEVVEHLRDEVLVAPEEGCRVQRIAATTGADFLHGVTSPQETRRREGSYLWIRTSFPHPSRARSHPPTVCHFSLRPIPSERPEISCLWPPKFRCFHVRCRK